MSKELDPTDFEAVISHYNIDSLDRQQEIWDRAIPKEMADHMFATFVHNAGLGPHQGKYTGHQPDFEKALLELEEEDPYDTEQAESWSVPGITMPWKPENWLLVKL